MNLHEGTHCTGHPRPARRARRVRSVVVLGLGLAAAIASPMHASYELDWHTFEGGGVMFATGGAYTLGGTAGQADAGVVSGGSYTLAGGFWPGGTLATTSVGSPGGPEAPTPADLPRAFVFGGAAPNPWVESTTVSFALPESRDVALDVFAADGRRVRGLLAAPLAAGPHLVTWDGRDDRGAPAPAGVYYLRLVAGSDRSEGKVVRMR